MLPLFHICRGARCLVVGGGRVAERRARALLRGGAEVTVVAPETTPGLNRLGVTVRRRRFRIGDVTGDLFLAVAATDDRAVNVRVAGACRKRGVPVNVADRFEEGDVIFPAVSRAGAFTAAISTGGRDPSAAASAIRAVAPALRSIRVRSASSRVR